MNHSGGSEKCFVTSMENSEVQFCETPLISVIIPTLNEEKVIGECLKALVLQKLPRDRFEVIVVDNGSVDRTLDVVRRFARCLRVTIRSLPGCHISELRNTGAREATGSFLAFLDADCIAPPHWLESAITVLKDAGDVVVGSFYTVPENSGWVARAWYGDMVEERQGPVSYVPSGTLFISSRIFRELGGFDRDIETSEDFELCQRAKAAGYPVVAHSTLSTVHLGTPQTLSAFWRKERWHGNGVRSVLLRRTSQRGFANTLALTAYALLSLVITLLAIPMAVVTGRFAVVAIGPALLAGGALLMAARAAARRRRWKYFFPLAALYVVYGVARSLTLLGAAGRGQRRVASSAVSPAADRSASGSRAFES
jgi:glycosyltransferase involved in cell wall biosynthesis